MKGKKRYIPRTLEDCGDWVNRKWRSHIEVLDLYTYIAAGRAAHNKDDTLRELSNIYHLSPQTIMRAGRKFAEDPELYEKMYFYLGDALCYV